MFEAGLGEIMTAAETAPTDLTGSPSAAKIAAHEVLAKRFKVKNDKLHTRLVLATTDCPERYDSPAAIVVQTYAPIGLDGFGDGRSAVVALEKKYRSKGTVRMQELHAKFAELAVTETDAFDPVRVIQELRRICIELGDRQDRTMGRTVKDVVGTAETQENMGGSIARCARRT